MDEADPGQTVADHVAAAAAAPERNRKAALAPETPPGICTNCGARLVGPVCHQCGQTVDTYHRPLVTLLGELLDGLFSLDGRAARTVPNLLLRPGRVTRRYLQGARARFVQPFKLYIVASLLFFLVTPLVGGFETAPVEDPASEEAIAAAREDLGAVQEELAARRAPEAAEAIRTRTDAALAEAQSSVDGAELDADANADEAADPAEDAAASEAGAGADAFGEDESETAAPDHLNLMFTGPNGEPLVTPEDVREALLPEDFGRADETSSPYWLRAWLAEKLERAIAEPDRLWREAAAWVPRVMFVLVPVFALLLSVVYAWRRRFFYFDHLIVALHFHAAMFIAMTVFSLVDLLVAGIGALAMLIYANVYLYRMQRVVYSRGRFSSSLRTLVLDIMYGVVLLVGLLAAFLAGFSSL